MTKEEFESQYADRQFTTVDALKELNLVAVKCDCKELGCEGWKMREKWYVMIAIRRWDLSEGGEKVMGDKNIKYEGVDQGTIYKYNNHPFFRQLVDTIANTFDAGVLSSQDVRDAIPLAERISVERKMEVDRMGTPRRDCCVVIKEMLEYIPADKEEFRSALEWNFNDAYYKAPEETLQWQRTMQTLQKHIPEPEEEWEFKVLSIFTTKSVDELKKERG